MKPEFDTCGIATALLTWWISLDFANACGASTHVAGAVWYGIASSVSGVIGLTILLDSVFDVRTP